MFNIGWSELLVLGAIVLFAFGPEDIPKIMYNFGRAMRRFRYMRYALSSQFEDFMEKAENQGKAPSSRQSAREVQADDEMDADDHLIEMMPLPKTTQNPVIDIEPDAEFKSTADRG